jgi:hypothetical protein
LVFTTHEPQATIPGNTATEYTITLLVGILDGMVKKMRMEKIKVHGTSYLYSSTNIIGAIQSRRMRRWAT